MRHHRRHIPSLLLAPLFVSACAGYAPSAHLVGMGRDAVVAHMGHPDRERQTDSGFRLEFPRGPYGKHTWFVYFDRMGAAKRAEQVLTEPNFAHVHEGMTQDAVLEQLGRPGVVQPLLRDRGVVWSYRYDNNLCQWFQVELSAQQVVRSAGYGQPPECEAPDGRMDK